MTATFRKPLSVAFALATLRAGTAISAPASASARRFKSDAGIASGHDREAGCAWSAATSASAEGLQINIDAPTPGSHTGDEETRTSPECVCCQICFPAS